MDTPRLPWEVLEGVIDLSCGYPRTLCSFALTCSQLRPRSHLMLFGRIQLESSDRVFAFVAFLLTNPQLRPLVHTIVVTQAAFGPSLLYMLPNLSSIECADLSQFGDPQDSDDRTSKRGHGEEEMLHIPEHMRLRVRVKRNVTLHRTSLACFGRLGAHIRTLRLNSVSFPTSLAFAQMLLAFASITCLVCKEVEIKATSSGSPLEAITRRLSERMQLRELTIDSSSLTRGGDSDRAACPGALLFDPRLTPPTLESLVVEVSRLDLLPYRSSWCRLRRLVLQLSGEASVKGVAQFLESFPNTPTLRDVQIEWRRWSRKRLVEELSRKDDTGHQPLKQLDHALLRFPKPRVTLIVAGPVDTKMLSLWVEELGKHLPALRARGGALIAERENSLTGNPSVPRHYASVQALVTSPDSRWVATGSLDFTVILWDTATGAMVQRWVAHNYRPVRSLAFSPDSKHLVSGGSDGKAAVWDLSRGARSLATLEGRAGSVLTCAWSPRGDTIATGSEEGTVGLWDPRTFQPRALLRLGAAVGSLAFSPDGLWLASGSHNGERSVYIVNVSSGALHRSLSGWNSPSHDVDVNQDDDPYCSPHIVAFDPSNGIIRLATVPWGSGSGIYVVDPETGSVLTRMGGKIGESVHMRDVSFSPDGTLVLGVSTPSDLINTLYTWEADTGLEHARLMGHTDVVQRARFSPCGRYIASASADRAVRVWRTSDGLCLATLSEHSTAVEHVAFSLDGNTLSSGARDGTVVIRQMRDITSVMEEKGLVGDAP